MRWSAIGLCFLMGCVSLPGTLPAPPADADDDPLTLAAESLTRGDDSTAAGHFERHVRTHPDQLLFRVHLADLYLKLGRDAEAKVHYERYTADAQESTVALQSHLVYGHTKLMEIAQRTEDRYAERLHRGIGLVLLTRQATDEVETSEEILCQAIAALLEAKEIRSGEARVFVYLAEAQDRAGNRRAADTSRATARNLSTPGGLTSAELRQSMK